MVSSSASQSSSSSATSCLSSRSARGRRNGALAEHRSRASRGFECGKAAFEVADQIIDVLETDVEAHRGSAWRPGRGGAHVLAIERYREALVAAPGGADAEQRELVDE